MAAVEERGVRIVVVDLSGLSFMDAKCAGVLIRVRCQADQRGVAMTVTHVSGIPRRVLEILGCYDRLRTCPTDGDYSPPLPPKAP